MVFSETNTREGLIQECERITGLGAGGISGSTERLKDFTSRLNSAKSRFFTLAFKYDALWNFDSTRQSDLPIATTTLTSGTREYALTLFHTEVLQIVQVFCKDSNGIFHELTPQDDKNTPNTYTLSTSAGTPKTYELTGNSIVLDPEPNYTSAAGIKLVFKRNDTQFAYTDGGVAVGIPSLFHAYLARQACLPYLVEKRLAQKNDVAVLIEKDEMAIKEFVSNRAKPKRSGLRVVQENNR